MITVPIGLERLDEVFHPPAVTGWGTDSVTDVSS
jgi:hypothetical protein